MKPTDNNSPSEATETPSASVLADWDDDPYLHELAVNHANGKGGWELILKFMRRKIAALREADQQEIARYLKDGETVAECVARNRQDVDTTLGLLAKALKRAEHAEQQAQQITALQAEVERLTKENRQMNQTLASTALDVFRAEQQLAAAFDAGWNATKWVQCNQSDEAVAASMREQHDAAYQAFLAAFRAQPPQEPT